MIEIRRSCTDDLPQIMVLLRQLWPGRDLNERALGAVFAAGLSSDTHVYLSVCDGPRVIGFASLQILTSLRTAGPFGHLDEFVVDESFRGGGIGGRLLNAVNSAALARGCLRVELNSGVQRIATHRFYESRGFERRAFHFFGPDLRSAEAEAPEGGVR